MIAFRESPRCAECGVTNRDAHGQIPKHRFSLYRFSMVAWQHVNSATFRDGEWIKHSVLLQIGEATLVRQLCLRCGRKVRAL